MGSTHSPTEQDECVGVGPAPAGAVEPAEDTQSSSVLTGLVDAPCQVTSQGLSLRSNFSWTLLGNSIYAACQWGMLIVLAKLGTPEMTGRFGLGLAVTAPVIMLANLDLRTVQATDARSEYTFGHYLGVRLAALAAVMPIIAATAFLFGNCLEAALVILAVGAAKAFESVSDVFYGLLMQRERLDRVAISMMVKGVLSLAALAAGVHLTGSVLWGTVLLAAAWALVLVVYDVRSGAAVIGAGGRADLRPRWERGASGRLALMALPLGVVAVLVSLNVSIPRYFVEGCLGERDLGIFVTLAYIQVAGSMVVRALGYSASARLGRHFVQGDTRAFRRMLVLLLAVGTVLGIIGVAGAALIGRPFLNLVYSRHYADRADVFTWLMVSALPLYLAMFLSYGLTAARRLAVQTPLLIVVVLVNIGACAWLVPAMGLQGAAVALAVSNTIWAAGSLAILAGVRPGAAREDGAHAG